MIAFLFITAVLIWGTSFYAISLQLGEVPTMQSVFYRFAFAALIMWLILLIRKAPVRYPVKLHLLFCGLGVQLFAINYVLTYLATQYLVSGMVSVVFSLLMIFNMLTFWLYFGDKPSVTLIAGGVFGFMGVVALFIEDFWGTQIDTNVMLGLSLALLGTMVVSSATVIARIIQLRNVDVLISNTWAMTYGAAFLLIACFVEGEPWQFSLQASYIWSLIFLVFAATVIAFWSYLTLIHRIGAARAAYVTVVFPLVALVVSTLFEDLQWTPPKLLGVVLIVAGNVLIVPRNRNKKITN